MAIHSPNKVIPAIVMTLVACRAWADVKMPAIFSDNMVLQKGVPIGVRGWAAPGEKLTVEFSGQRKAATAGPSGKWTARLDPLPQSSEPAEMRVKGKNAITIRNVLVGDVWLASGQSNMEMPVHQVQTAAQETAAADYPGLRVFMVRRDLASSPKEDVAGNG